MRADANKTVPPHRQSGFEERAFGRNELHVHVQLHCGCFYRDLAIVAASGVLMLPRPTNATSFSLQQDTDRLPTNLDAVENLVAGVGRQNRATVQTAGNWRFCRLTSTRVRQFGQGASVLSNAPFPELFSRLEKRTLTLDLMPESVICSGNGTAPRIKSEGGIPITQIT